MSSATPAATAGPPECSWYPNSPQCVRTRRRQGSWLRSPPRRGAGGSSAASSQPPGAGRAPALTKEQDADRGRGGSSRPEVEMGSPRPRDEDGPDEQRQTVKAGRRQRRAASARRHSGDTSARIRVRGPVGGRSDGGRRGGSAADRRCGAAALSPRRWLARRVDEVCDEVVLTACLTSAPFVLTTYHVFMCPGR